MEPITTKEQKIEIIEKLMDELMLTDSDIQTRDYKNMQEGYIQTKEFMLKLISSNASDKNLDDVIEVVSALLKENTIYSTKTIKLLNENFNNILKKRFCLLDDVFEMLYVTRNEGNTEMRHKILDMIDNFTSEHHIFWIDSLTNQPQNTTETKQVNQQIKK